MRNIKLTIEYDGTNYSGWQVQKSTVHSPQSTLKTIQEEIEKAIAKITGKRSKLYGSGRTDRGVHAKEQIANFHTLSRLSLDTLKRGLNAVLPDDISITKIEEVDKNFHSRFDVKAKTYRYTILNSKSSSPFIKNYSLYIPYRLNLSTMKKEARVLLGRHDFKSFRASDKKQKSTVRTIKKINIGSKGSLITIDIEADGFLYNMVRNIIGTLIEIGRGKFPPGSIKRILKAKDRTVAGPTAPAHGLCLMKVRY